MEDFDYSQIKPIDKYIEPFKRSSPVHYGFHPYFTTQPYNVVQKYISNYSRLGDLVADPFIGSGVTAVESLRLKRRVFALDLNPFSVFLTNTKCSIVNIPLTKKYFNNILKNIENECNEIESLPIEEANKLDIPYWYPSDVKLPSNSDVEFLHEIFTKKQLYQFSLLRSEIEKLENSDEKNLLYIIFCGTLSRANIAYSLPNDGRSIYSGDFTIFHTGRYRIPKVKVEIPVLPVLKRRFENVIKAKEETNLQLKGFVNKNTLKTVVGSATDLKPYLKDYSVDYVYTDPPYGGHITYLDLSTIYNAWLKFEVTDEMKGQEIIEGGEIKHTDEQYKNLLSEALQEISRVLKPNRWLSLVFHHKEPSLWTNIVETSKAVGLEYKNSVVQHTKLPSWHKVDVPQTVLSSQMIINFIRKDVALVSYIKADIPLNKLVLNVAEREILSNQGIATFEGIINALVPELFEHNYIHEQAQTSTDKIFNILKQEFDYDENDKTFKIREDRQKKLGNYLPLEDKIKMYLASYMRINKKTTLEQLIPDILPKLINGETPTGEEILDELKKIAVYDGQHWVLKSGSYQHSLDLVGDNKTFSDTKIPEIDEHDQIIYRLSLLGSKYGYRSKIGHQELKEPFLKAVSTTNKLYYYNVSDKDNVNIDNIDCMWLAPNQDYPLYVFEVEHTTTITSAFERFVSLLKAVPDIGDKRRLILVISKKNEGRFNTVIKESSYVGTPHFINNKVRYIYEEIFLDKFNELLREKDPTKFEGILSTPELG